MKVVSIHNLLWAHYKNALFEEIQKQARVNDIEWHVIQIARNELRRKDLESSTSPYQYDYDYDLLFDDYYENLSSKAIFFALLKKINKISPDVINLTGFYTWVHLALIAYAKFRGIKIIISNDSTRGDNEVAWWKEKVKRWAVQNASGFFCFGTKAADYMKDLGAKESQILAQHCAVVDNDLLYEIFNQATPIQNPKAFIYVGRFSPEKNLTLLLNAFASLPENDWQLILLGTGNEEMLLKNLASQLNIEHKIKWIKGQPWFKIPEYLREASVLVLPSSSEPWGLVVNEAMACKKICIVSDKCGAAKDLIENQNTGFVFEHTNQNQLAILLQKCISSPTLTHEMGENAFKKIQEFSIQNAAFEMINGIKKI